MDGKAAIVTYEDIAHLIRIPQTIHRLNEVFEHWPLLGVYLQRIILDYISFAFHVGFAYVRSQQDLQLLIKPHKKASAFNNAAPKFNKSARGSNTSDDSNGGGGGGGVGDSPSRRKKSNGDGSNAKPSPERKKSDIRRKKLLEGLTPEEVEVRLQSC
jgi:hypothetical protein